MSTSHATLTVATELPATGDQPAQRGLCWQLAWCVPLLAAGPWLLLTAGLSLPAGVAGLSGLVLVLMFAPAVVTDLRGRRIRNWTVYPAVAFALLVNLFQTIAELSSWEAAATACGGIGIGPSLFGGLACFAAMFTLFLLFGGGAGDVKLMTVVGALLGWFDGFQVWLFAMLIAAAFCLLWAAVRVGWKSVAAMLVSLLGEKGHLLNARLGWSGRKATGFLRRRIPLAPFFAAGCALVLIVQAVRPNETLLRLVLNSF